MLPKLPVLPKRLSSGLMDGKSQVYSLSKDALRVESEAFGKLLELRASGLPFSVSKVGPVVRNHGCRQCPWYGSSFCFHLLFPPDVHVDGICRERLDELLDVAVLYGSSDGLLIRKHEAVERVRKHILLLEVNLSDYRSKRLSALKGANRGLDGISFEDVAFDGYEVELRRQLEVLSVKYAEFLQNEDRLSVKGSDSVVRALTPLDVGRWLRESRIVEVPDVPLVDDVVEPVVDSGSDVLVDEKNGGG